MHLGLERPAGIGRRGEPDAGALAAGEHGRSRSRGCWTSTQTRREVGQGEDLVRRVDGDARHDQLAVEDRAVERGPDRIGADGAVRRLRSGSVAAAGRPARPGRLALSSPRGRISSALAASGSRRPAARAGGCRRASTPTTWPPSTSGSVPSGWTPRTRSRSLRDPDGGLGLAGAPAGPACAPAGASKPIWSIRLW